MNRGGRGGGTVRIVAGKYRGRRLVVPPGIDVRPTGDRVKVVLFDILGPGIAGARVLDLFAGTGALGLEAASRGAGRVVLVESAPAVARAIESAVATLGAGPEVQVVRDDVMRYLATSREAPFDLVLADPPYAAGLEDALLQAVPRHVGPGGFFVLQHTRRWQPPDAPAPFALVRSARFGDTVGDFFRREEASGGEQGAHGALSGDV